MIVDCDTCPVRGSQCADCVVTALTAPLSADMPLDRQEQRAVSVLVAAGLVRPDRAAGLRARREPWTGARAAV